jgi:hypothetical protein
MEAAAICTDTHVLTCGSHSAHVKYEGKVLLLLAKERDPLFDFLPGWKSVVPRDLSVFYVQGRHRYLITSNNLREIANLIQSILKECFAGDSGSWRASA